MAKITKVHAREILDSRGNPTIEVDVHTENSSGRFAVPSGASTGTYEAVELRDGGNRYKGKGVLKAVENVNKKIAKEVIGLDATEQEKLDNLMIGLDGTKNKGNLGANAILGVSIASCKAAAASLGKPVYSYLGKPPFYLPVPSMNVINGGQHAGNALNIQEHMIMPTGAKTFAEAVRMCSETYHTLKKIIKDKYGPLSTNVGDEGGFAPDMKGYEEPFEAITKAIDGCGYSGKIKIAIDPAASTFFEDGKYTISGKSYTSAELVDFYRGLTEKYPLISIEDGFAEEDWEGFSMVTKELKGTQIIGDDLFVTNPERIQKGIDTKAANCLLLKVNQIGTLTESIAAANLSFRNGWGVMVSHRSGETEDPFIADLVVGLGTKQIKTGAPCRSDRTSKYNQLMRIEEELGKDAKYAGENFRKV